MAEPEIDVWARGGLDSVEDFRELVQIVREADLAFEKEGGGTRHWLREQFLPLLDARGWEIRRKPNLGSLLADDDERLGPVPQEALDQVRARWPK